MKQNYFSHNNQILIEKDGLAMGAPPQESPPKSFYKTRNKHTSLDIEKSVEHNKR
jgi:hypothetical protein